MSQQSHFGFDPPSPPPIERRTVIVDYYSTPKDFLAMCETGEVRVFLNAADVVDWVRKRDERLGKSRRAIIITAIEWRDVPDDFVPPDGAA
jgi:hypothetical protein